MLSMLVSFIICILCNYRLKWHRELTKQVPVIDDYHQTPNISRTLFGNKIVDLSDVVGESPVGAAPTTSSFST